jgi:NTP pyrophosphatase (non-canonical NTP hydrolase)
MSSSPTLDQLSHRGLEIAGLYDDLNRAQRGRVWTRAETMMGFVGDVGDLAKLVMSAEGARSDVGGPDGGGPAETREALEHELADCLWAVLVLAHRYDVDLAAAYGRTMDELEGRLRG